jgi:hypothetical protein
MARLTERIVAEALDAVRWDAMLREVAARLPELCRDAADAATLARWRLGYARVGRA